MIITGELKEKVLRILVEHQGKANAIKGKEIAEILGFRDDRSIREAIFELINEGYAIASRTEYPFGYYLVTNQQEAEEYSKSLRNRIKETCVRRAQFKRATYLNLNSLVQGKLL